VRITAASALMVSMALSAPSAAQDSSIVDSAAVEVAAARHATQYFAEDLAGKRVALETRTPMGGPRSGSQLSILANILGAVPTRGDSVVVCGELPSSCRFQGFEGLVRVYIQSLTDSVADVAVGFMSPTSLERVPIATREPTFRFVKRNGSWEFDRVTTVRMT
jgi:hypothetical protein